VINACGTNPLIGDCADAKAQILPDVAMLDALSATAAPIGLLQPVAGGIYTVLAGPGLNVIDVDKIKLSIGSILRIDGQGNSDAVVILRVGEGMLTKEAASIELVGGATAENFMIYGVGGSCRIGWSNSGFGTLLFPVGKVRFKVDTQWTGAVAGGTQVDLGWNVKLDHAPFLGLAH
jgi:hypothetical protein